MGTGCIHLRVWYKLLSSSCYSATKVYHDGHVVCVPLLLMIPFPVNDLSWKVFFFLQQSGMAGSASPGQQ